jgi:hypothetical protein
MLFGAIALPQAIRKAVLACAWGIYSITASAVASSVGGTSSPIASRP